MHSNSRLAPPPLAPLILLLLAACSASQTTASVSSGENLFAGGTKYQAETWDPSGTTHNAVFNEGGGEGQSVAGFQVGEVIKWKAVALNGATQIGFALGAPYAGGSAELWADAVGTGTKLGVISLGASTGGWNVFQEKAFAIQSVRGTHDVYLRATATGGDWLYKLDYFELPAAGGPSDAGSGGTTGGSDGQKIQAENWVRALSTGSDFFNEAGGEGQSVAGFRVGDVLGYANVSFSGQTELDLQVGAPYAGGSAEIWVDAVGASGRLIGTAKLEQPTGAWNTFSALAVPVVATTGTHAVFIRGVATGGDWLFKVDWFQLKGGSTGGSGTPDAGTVTTDAGVPGSLGLGSIASVLPPGAALPSNNANAPVRPKVTANVHGPVPTNDWWSSLVFQRFPDQPYSQEMFPHPLALKAEAGGLGISLPTTPTLSGVPSGIGEYHYSFSKDLLLGVAGLNASRTEVDGWSDWTVTASWSDGSHSLKATFGHGLPFVYATVSGGAASVSFTAAPHVVSNSGNVLGVTVNGHAYGLYAPTGSTWTVSGTNASSTLGGKNYVSVAGLPDATAATLNAYAAFAFAFVTDTHVSYAYDAAHGVVNTTYTATVSAKEGAQSKALLALYPYQWKHSSNALTSYSYPSPRGTLKVLSGTSFQTSLPVSGVLPNLPNVGIPDASLLKSYVEQVNTESSHIIGGSGAGTYWTGKGLGRVAGLVRIAEQVGDTTARDAFLSFLKSTLQDWFTASAGKAQRLFYYDGTWGTLIGYPAEYGSDLELNDHHFHYGYYVMAAATVAQYDPAWASSAQWGPMVNLLIKDVANPVADGQFPALRNFDPYEGHSWASGHAAFASGNNQESSSEAMNFSAGLVLWGAATGNVALRNLGVYLYTTEGAAIDEAWFDLGGDVFPSGFDHTTAGMVWGDGAAYATWFTSVYSQVHGINMLPITGGSLYLGHSPSHAVADYAEMVKNNGSENASMIWADVNWMALALGDPARAAGLLDANPGYTPEEGCSRAFTYHWIHALAALGTPDVTITADSPTAAVFSKSGVRTYVAYNAGSSAQTVTFSNGKTLTVAAHALATGQ